MNPEPENPPPAPAPRRGRIPVPFRERWRDMRLRIIPALVFIGAALLLATLWKGNLATPVLLGQVEAVQANVSSYRPGMLAELNVTRFQRVKAGDPVGQVLVTDPKILSSSLAVIQSEIQMLRVGMAPIVAQQQNAMDYNRLRLDWMRQRTDLAMAQVNLQLAEAEYHRMDELFKDKIIAARVFEQAKGAYDRLKNECDQRSHLVDEQARGIQSLLLTNAVEISQVSDEPLRAAIAGQESKLRLTEAELSPIILRSPLEGTVNAIFRRSGEAVTAGEPIVAIAADGAVRIVSYLRPPIVCEPGLRAKVEVRTRGFRHQTGSAEIIEVGTQFEPVAAALLPQLKLATVELGLPIGISLPPNLQVRPGELVDLMIQPKVD